MTSVRIEGFLGMVPRLSDRLLPDHGAADAQNARLTSGELRGLRTPEKIKEFGTTIKNAARLYKVSDLTEVWWSSTQADSDIVKGPLVNDTLDRYYWTGGGENFIAYNKIDYIQSGSAGPYRLGTPSPTAAPALAVTGGSGTSETRVYCYTFVNDWNEESAPSPVIQVSGFINGSWDLSSLQTTHSDLTGRVSLTHKRIYRTVTGQSSVEYFFVAEIAIGTTTYSDTIPSSTTVNNSVLQSWNWDVPNDSILGVTVHPNGFLVGFVGTDLYFSVPYHPHAWPSAYVLSLESPIVGLAIYNNQITVLTKSQPYFAVGNSPDSISLNKSDASEPCLSKASIASTLSGVLYASQNGLVLFNESGPSVITKNLLTIEEWARYLPSAIRGAQQGNEYLGYYSSARGFLFAPSEPFGLFSEINAIDDVSNVITDDYTGQTWIIRSGTVYRWEPPDGVPLYYDWTSKQFDFPRPVNLGAYIVKMTGESLDQAEATLTLQQAYNDLRIGSDLQPINFSTINASRAVSVGTTPPGVEDISQTQNPVGGSSLFNITNEAVLNKAVVLKVYAGGRLVYTNNVVPNMLGRLPSGFKEHVWQFQLIGNDDIYSLAVAEVPKELINV